MATALLGAAFLCGELAEYRRLWTAAAPVRVDTGAYGSTFYTLTCYHGLHVLVGLLMLAYVICLPRPGPGSDRSPHRPLHAAALYWHFVDAAWIVIVLLLYLLPQWRQS